MQPSEAKKRVLFLDDETMIADSLAMIFSGHGYDARAVYSAEEALSLLPDWTPHFALIDVCLPGMNGIEFAFRMRNDYPGCILSLFSGLDADAEQLESTRQPERSIEVLLKPVHPEILLSLASRLLGASTPPPFPV